MERADKMDDQKLEKTIKAVTLAVRYVVMYILYRILESLCLRVHYVGYLSTIRFTGVPTSEGSYTVELIVLQIVFALIGAYSLFRTFSLHNIEERDRIVAEHKDQNYFSILAYTAKSRNFLISLAILLPLVLLFGANAVFDTVLLRGMMLIPRRLIECALMGAVMLFARTGANVYIYDSQTVDRVFEKIGKKGRLLLDVAVIFITYLPGAWMCFLAFIMVRTMVKILWQFPTVTVFIVTVLFMLPLLIFVFKAILARYRFLKDLRDTCKLNGFKLSKIKRPYASLFKFRSDVNFTVEAHGKKYSCGFISCIYRNSSVYFNKNGTYVQKYPVEIRKMFQLFDFQKTHKYGFEADGIKIIIASPAPPEAYAIEFGNVGEIRSDNKLWDYRYFDECEFAVFLTKDKI